MAYSQPYGAWFTALAEALAGADGPFVAPAAIEYWADEGLQDALPDDHLIQALTRTMPHCLISWGGGTAQGYTSGGNSHRELVRFVLRYCCGAPGHDYYQALVADGTSYWGAFATHNWILDKALPLAVAGFDAPAELLEMTPIALGDRGKLAFALRFGVNRLRAYSD